MSKYKNKFYPLVLKLNDLYIKKLNQEGSSLGYWTIKRVYDFKNFCIAALDQLDASSDRPIDRLEFLKYFNLLFDLN